MGVANNSQRGTSERVREKMLLKSGTDAQGLIELTTICTKNDNIIMVKSCTAYVHVSSVA